MHCTYFESDEQRLRMTYQTLLLSLSSSKRTYYTNVVSSPASSSSSSSSSLYSLFDLDCNLTHVDLKQDIPQLLQSAFKLHIHQMLVPGSTLQESLESIQLCRQYPTVSRNELNYIYIYKISIQMLNWYIEYTMTGSVSYCRRSSVSCT